MLLMLPAGAWKVGAAVTASHEGQSASGDEREEAVAEGDGQDASSQEDAGAADDSPDASSQEAEDTAEEVCQERLARLAGPDNPFGKELIGAYPASVDEAAAAHEQQRGAGFRSKLRDRDPSSFAAVCFFEGDATGLAHPPPEGAPLPDGVPTRVQEVVLLDGEAVGFAIGRGELRPAPLSGEAER